MLESIAFIVPSSLIVNCMMISSGTGQPAEPGGQIVPPGTGTARPNHEPTASRKVTFCSPEAALVPNGSVTRAVETTNAAASCFGSVSGMGVPFKNVIQP